MQLCSHISRISVAPFKVAMDPTVWALVFACTASDTAWQIKFKWSVDCLKSQEFRNSCFFSGLSSFQFFLTTYNLKRNMEIIFLWIIWTLSISGIEINGFSSGQMSFLYYVCNRSEIHAQYVTNNHFNFSMDLLMVFISVFRDHFWCNWENFILLSLLYRHGKSFSLT